MSCPASSSPADQIFPQKESGVKSNAQVVRPVLHVVVAKKAILSDMYLGFREE
jgi:hypothetical protein